VQVLRFWAALAAEARQVLGVDAFNLRSDAGRLAGLLVSHASAAAAAAASGFAGGCLSLMVSRPSSWKGATALARSYSSDLP
jgi:hypothetical protein